MNNNLNLQTIKERDADSDNDNDADVDVIYEKDEDEDANRTTTDTDDDKKNGNIVRLSSELHESQCHEPTFDPTFQQEQYNMMIHMTLELVRDLTIVKKNDEVITAYGMKGILVTRNGSCGSMEIKLPFGGNGGAMLYHRQPDMVHKNLSPHDYEQAMEHLEQIRKLILTMHCQQWNIPIIDEVCVPCLFDKPYCRKIHNNKSNNKNKNKSNTTTSMNTAKKGGNSCSSSITSTENSVSNQGTLITKHTAAVAKKKRRSWFSRQSSSPTSSKKSLSLSLSTSTTNSSNRSRVQVALERDETNGTLKKKKKSTRTKFCDVCGNPVCSKHIIPSEGQQFRMCADCQFDFTQMFETTSSQKCMMNTTKNNTTNSNGRSLNNTSSNLLDLDHIPQLTQSLDRLVQYYTRMVLQLTFCVPNLRELADRLTSKERSNSKIALGTGTISFLGAALGVAGAAALLTPAGPALLLAAVATSASSAAIQGGHLGYNAVFNMNQKEVNQLADRILGWHGLCLGILDALEQLRQTLLQQILAITIATTAEEVVATTAILELDTVTSTTAENGKGKGKDDITTAAKIKQQKQKQLEEKNALILQQVLNSRSHNNNFNNKSTSEQSMEVLNTLALGSYHTTRHGLTGVGLTASMGASYSQMINASIQTVPVVGAAFSVGCMAMDATNIASTLQKLQKPSSKAVALRQVEESIPLHIPATIQYEVEALLGAINKLRERQEEAQRNQQQDLIEKELEELNI